MDTYVAQNWASESKFARATEFLGGKKIIRHAPLTHLAAHELILNGLPTKALHYLIGNLAVLPVEMVVTVALGISLRTYQRLEDASTKVLGHDLGGRAWKFAELLAQATSIFGSREEAEQWFMQA